MLNVQNILFPYIILNNTPDVTQRHNIFQKKPQEDIPPTEALQQCKGPV